MPEMAKSEGVRLESRLNEMRILGLPVQFVLVVAISLALTIYFGAWAADARVSERAAQSTGQSVQQFDFSSAAGTSSGSGLSGELGQDAGAQQYGSAAEGQGWEKYFLVACPLH